MIFPGDFQIQDLLQFSYSVLWHWSHTQYHKVCTDIDMVCPVSTVISTSTQIIKVWFSLVGSQPIVISSLNRDVCKFCLHLFHKQWAELV